MTKWMEKIIVWVMGAFFALVGSLEFNFLLKPRFYVNLLECSNIEVVGGREHLKSLFLKELLQHLEVWSMSFDF